MVQRLTTASRRAASMAFAVFAAAMVQQAACDAQGDTADGAGSHLVPAVQPVHATPDWHKPAQVHAAIKEADEALVDKDPHNDFGSGFFASLTMILVTEIGDRTFFIAAIMAMKHSRGVVLAGALSALALMTVLSAALGYVVPNIIKPSYARMLATLCFGYFGVTLLREAQGMQATDLLEEVEEVRTELEKKDLEDNGEGEIVSKADQTVIAQAFMLTFVAEWGDRSQIATIALGAAKNVVGVTLGGILGHTICTGFAVFGGHMIASRVSEKQVTIIGGVVFLVCSLMSAYYVYTEDIVGHSASLPSPA